MADSEVPLQDHDAAEQQPIPPSPSNGEPVPNGTTDTPTETADVEMKEDTIPEQQEQQEQPIATEPTLPSTALPPQQQPQQPTMQPTVPQTPASAPQAAPSPTATPTHARNSPHPPPNAPPKDPLPHGSPTRVYLNTQVTPTLLEGMKILAQLEPEKPLKWLSEFLAERSREVEG